MYGLPDYGIPFTYAQVNPGWFSVPCVLPHPQAQIWIHPQAHAGVPAQQQFQPGIRQQQCQQEQGGTHTDPVPMDVDPGQPDEMPEAARARTRPTVVSVGTQTELSGTGIQAPGDEAQDKTASAKRALRVKRRACWQPRLSTAALALPAGHAQNRSSTTRYRCSQGVISIQTPGKKGRPVRRAWHILLRLPPRGGAFI